MDNKTKNRTAMYRALGAVMAALGLWRLAALLLNSLDSSQIEVMLAGWGFVLGCGIILLAGRPGAMPPTIGAFHLIMFGVYIFLMSDTASDIGRTQTTDPGLPGGAIFGILGSMVLAFGIFLTAVMSLLLFALIMRIQKGRPGITGAIFVLVMKTGLEQYFLRSGGVSMLIPAGVTLVYLVAALNAATETDDDINKDSP